jgi:hypothetical protein
MAESPLSAPWVACHLSGRQRSLPPGEKELYLIEELILIYMGGPTISDAGVNAGPRCGVRRLS